MVGRMLVLLVVVLCGVTRGGAQQAPPQLPEYTDPQRWNRLAFIDAAWISTVIAIGKQEGHTLDQIGDQIAEFHTQGWLGGADARWFFVSLRQNHLAYPNGRVEVTSLTDSVVVARFNTPFLGTFGLDRDFYGVTIADWQTVNLRVFHRLAEYGGLDLTSRMDGDWMVLTMRSRFEAPRQSMRLRADRAGFVARAITVDVIRNGKARGQTALAAGLESAKTWASGWTANDTPWRLFRTVTWNMMIDPDYHCQILTGSAEMVRARCSRPWVASVRAWAPQSGVSPEEFDAYQLGLEQGIATSLGMTWEVQLEGNDRLITVRRK